MDRARRRELRDTYRQTRPEAGVYLIRNRATGRVFVASTTNLAGARNRFDFARTTDTPSALDEQVRADAAAHGLDALRFEIAETLEFRQDATEAEIGADLRVLEDLWREKVSTDEGRVAG